MKESPRDCRGEGSGCDQTIGRNVLGLLPLAENCPVGCLRYGDRIALMGDWAERYGNGMMPRVSFIPCPDKLPELIECSVYAAGVAVAIVCSGKEDDRLHCLWLRLDGWGANGCPCP